MPPTRIRSLAAVVARFHLPAAVALLSAFVGARLDSASASTRPPEPIRVGVLYSLTGTMAISERSLVDAIRLAAREINEDGGVMGRPIQLIVEDGASDWPTFARRAEKLITQDHVAAIFGCWTSASRKAVLPVIECHDHLLWYVVQYEGLETSANVIYGGATPNQQILPALDWFLTNAHVKKPFLVGSDYVFPRSANHIIRNYFERRGIAPVGEIYVPLGTSAFRATVMAIRKSGADLVLNTLNGDSNEGFFAEYARMGAASKPAPVVSFSVAEDEIRSIGTHGTAGHFAAWSYFQSIRNDANARFVAAFKHRYGADRVTDDPIEAAYSQFYLFARAVARAGSTDPKEIRRAALGMEWNAPSGLVRIDPSTQHTWRAARVGRLRPDGQFDVIWSSTWPVRPRPFGPLEDAETDAAMRSWIPIDPSVDTARVLAGLGSADFSLQIRTAEELSRAGMASLPVLEFALARPEPAVRATAAYTLGLMGAVARPRALVLVPLLRDENPLVRDRAMWAVRQIGCCAQDFVDPLVDGLGSNDPVVRRLACAALCASTPRSSDVLPTLAGAYLEGPRSGRDELGDLMRSIAEAADDRHELRAIGPLDRAIGKLAGRMDENRLSGLRRSLNHLRDRSSARLLSAVSWRFLSQWWVIALLLYGALFPFVGLVALRHWPLTILQISQELEPFIDARLPDRLGGLRLPLRALLVVGIFQYNRRVLDAWVESKLADARENFEAKDTVAQRRVYVPCPVSVGGQPHSRATPQLLQPIVGKPRWCVLVHGEGGAGKTALACEIGRWALGADPAQRLAATHYMLPILIEPDAVPDGGLTPEALIGCVKGHLCALVGSPGDISENLVQQLMRRSRLLIIADDVPVQPSTADFPAAALVVTSRQKLPLGGIPLVEIEPQRISANHLSTFLDAYLTAKMARAKLSDSDFFAACQHLSAIVRDRSITALLGKLYAEQLIERPAGWVGPRDVPGLIFEYVGNLNRVARGDRLDDGVIRAHLQRIARRALRANLKLDPVPVGDALQCIGGGEPARILRYLEGHLRLIRTIRTPMEHVAFTMEPVGEYLAASSFVMELAGNEEAWRELLGKVAVSVNDSLAVALWDCVVSFGRHYGTPAWLPTELRKLVPPDPAAVAPDAVKIGVLHSLTGTMSISEQPLVDAVRLAVEEVNRTGGVLGREVVPIIEDGASDPFVFAQKAQRLVTEEKVCALFGCWTSADRKAVLRVVEEYDHLLFYPLQYEGYESSRNIIYTGAAPNQQIVPAVGWCTTVLGRRRAFLIGSDYVFPRTANRIIRRTLGSLGATCVGEEYCRLGERDYGAIVRQVQGSHADVIYNTTNGDSNIALFRALHEAGLGPDEVPVISFSIAEHELRSIGTELTAGHYCAWNYFQSVDTPGNRQFVQAFKARFGDNRVTDDPIEAAYISVRVFALAVKRARSTDPRAIREACRGLSYEAPGGEIVIDAENQHTWTVARVGRIKADGQFELVWNSPEIIHPDPYLGGDPACAGSPGTSPE